MLSVLAALLVALPYQDPQGRFVIDLPADWQSAASPGDNGGVTFTRNREGVLAICQVRVIPLGQTSLDAYVKTLVQATQGQPGYKLIASGTDKLAGTTAWRRRFSAAIDPQGKLTKTVDERVTKENGIAYLVHVETVTQAFDSFVPEFSQLVNSFAFPRVESPTAAVGIPNYVLVGSWVRDVDKSARLTFYADGRVLFGAQGGIYRIDGNKLLLQLGNAEPTMFYWELVSGNLTLVSPQLAIPLRYRRIAISE